MVLHTPAESALGAKNTGDINGYIDQRWKFLLRRKLGSAHSQLVTHRPNEA